MQILCKNKISNEHGFSLLELMAVMIILGLISAIAVPSVYKHIRKGKQQTAKTQIDMIDGALEAYRMDTGDFPSQEQGLEALRSDPGVENWDGPYLKKKIPLDPWNNEYLYNNPGQHGNEIDVFSLGKDHQEGGEKEDRDIVSW
jgi:general secretion pathway protein G